MWLIAIMRNERSITSPAFYTNLFRRAGAHIYTDSGEAVIADNEMIMVHRGDIPSTTLLLHCGDKHIKNYRFSTVIYNTVNGERIL